MLTSTLTTFVKNPIKESFYRKRKKKTINILIVFFIFHKSNYVLNTRFQMSCSV